VRIEERREQALARFASAVRERFAARVRELTLFGSVARGEATAESDVDVAVFIDGLTTAEARELDAITGDLLTELDVLITPLALSTERAEELRRRERLLLREIARDGVPL